MKSVFVHKEITPTNEDLTKALGFTFKAWEQLVVFTKELYPSAREEWNFASAKYGWSYRLSDKKRVLVYLLPRDKFFKVAFVFGQKATDAIMHSDIAEHIKTEIRDAKVYAEGRGVRLEVRDSSVPDDIKKLIAIKISN